MRRIGPFIRYQKLHFDGDFKKRKWEICRSGRRGIWTLHKYMKIMLSEYLSKCVCKYKHINTARLYLFSFVPWIPLEFPLSSLSCDLIPLLQWRYPPKYLPDETACITVQIPLTRHLLGYPLPSGTWVSLRTSRGDTQTQNVVYNFCLEENGCGKLWGWLERYWMVGRRARGYMMLPICHLRRD